MTDIVARFANLTTAHLTDGCLRAGQQVRCGPAGMAAVEPGARLAGRALPVRHAGSVDIFLEALVAAEAGDVLVVDNQGRLDEACVGDLMVLEAAGAGLAGIVIWGLHRDSVEIREIGLPVFSQGSMPTGPLRLDPRADDALDAAAFGEWTITRDDLVFADDDGVLFVPAAAATTCCSPPRGSATPSELRHRSRAAESRCATSSSSPPTSRSVLPTPR